MRFRRLAILLTLPLWACASEPPGGAGNAATSNANAPAAAAAPSSAPDDASTTAKVVGGILTPLHLIFLSATCLGAAPLAAPGALASTIVPFSNSAEGSGGQLLVNDVKEACGPPYITVWH